MIRYIWYINHNSVDNLTVWCVAEPRGAVEGGAVLQVQLREELPRDGRDRYLNLQTYRQNQVCQVYRYVVNQSITFSTYWFYHLLSKNADLWFSDTFKHGLKNFIKKIPNIFAFYIIGLECFFLSLNVMLTLTKTKSLQATINTYVWCIKYSS